MQRVRVKVCGLTTVENARVVANAGVDSIGLVFFKKSLRNVSIAKAEQIVNAMPAFVTTTALFVNPSKDLVEEVITTTKIDLLQFHGDESEQFCNQFSRPYIKAIRINNKTDILASSNQYTSAKAILFDTLVKGVAGGTGKVFDWQLLDEKTLQNINNPVILAGGLNVENVAQAITKIRPWAVDVSGGVEITAGIKSTTKVQEFIKMVNR